MEDQTRLRLVDISTVIKELKSTLYVKEVLKCEQIFFQTT